jgi:hypothetical protein
MLLAGFELAMPRIKRLQVYALDSTHTGIAYKALLGTPYSETAD